MYANLLVHSDDDYPIPLMSFSPAGGPAMQIHKKYRDFKEVRTCMVNVTEYLIVATFPNIHDIVLPGVV